jgi:hypothetical protein
VTSECPFGTISASEDNLIDPCPCPRYETLKTNLNDMKNYQDYSTEVGNHHETKGESGAYDF